MKKVQFQQKNVSSKPRYEQGKFLEGGNFMLANTISQQVEDQLM